MASGSLKLDERSQHRRASRADRRGFDILMQQAKVPSWRVAFVCMGRSPHDALRLLRQQARSGRLAALCNRHGVVLLVVHGSVTIADTLSEPGDLDVAFLGKRGHEVDVVALINDVIDVVRIDAVDVMNLDAAGPVARARALSPHSVVLFESENGLFAREQIRALTEAMETRPMRMFDLELMAA